MFSDIYTGATAFIHGIASDLSGGDAMAKGLVTVALLSGVGYLSRNIPKRIRGAFDRRCKVSVKFENPQWNEEKRLNYMAASTFVAKHQVERKHLMEPNESEDGKVEVTPDYDSGWFWYNGRIYCYSLSKAEEQGAVPRAVTLSTWFSTPEKIMKLIDIEGYRRRMSDITTRRYYRYTDKDWNSVSRIEDNSPLFLPRKTKERLDKAIANYRDNAEWFKARGIPRKLMVILYGEPGTGKSRIGRYIADQLGYNFGTLSSGTDFLAGVRAASEESRRLVVSVPDFDEMNIGGTRDMDKTIEMVESRAEDSASATADIPAHWRKPQRMVQRNGKISTVPDDDAEMPAIPGGGLVKLMEPVSLSEVLNLFEGDIPLNNSVVVMSTNHIERIDSALLRSSRCDLLLEIGRLGYDEVNDFFKHYYESTEDLGDVYKDIQVTAAFIMGAFKEHPHNRDAWLSELSTQI